MLKNQAKDALRVFRSSLRKQEDKSYKMEKLSAAQRRESWDAIKAECVALQRKK